MPMEEIESATSAVPQTSAPRVFVSHASDDQDRFVREFAKRLRENGVDAWYSEWEMKPGASLVDKIFEQGIGGSEAFIVVLSEESVRKPWVREELNAAFVARIANQTRLIPVVIDDCQIPVALSSTLYERIRNLDTYEVELKSILSSIFGLTDKPPIGQSPFQDALNVEPVFGLSKVDSAVLKTIYDWAIKENTDAMSTDWLWGRVESIGISREDFEDTLVILDEQRYIRGRRGDGRISAFALTLHGFHQYAIAYIPDIDDVLQLVAARIVNEQDASLSQIEAAVARPKLIVEYVIDLFESQGWLKVMKFIGGEGRIGGVSPQLKRVLKEWST